MRNHGVARAAGSLVAALVLVFPGFAQAVEKSGAGFVAGLAPQHRPEGAPVIKEFTPDPAWRARALTGVSAPVPASLRFLDDQGAWYIPFNHPGGPGHYDLRRWFGEASRSAEKQGR